jgi:uncharacterized protein with GYD domain
MKEFSRESAKVLLASALSPLAARVQTHSTGTEKGVRMPKYLIKASYTSEGARGVAKEGGTSRRDTIAKLAEGAGGSMEAFYFAFGETDAYVICDMPDNATAAAVALAVNSSGAANATTVILMTPEEVDEATKRRIDYRAPGA